MIRKIYVLESSGGRNDKCQTNKQFNQPYGYNGFGYRQNARENICFGSHEEVQTHVENWVKDKLQKGYTLGQLTCTYNTGIKTDTCKYYTNYLTLK